MRLETAVAGNRIGHWLKRAYGETFAPLRAIDLVWRKKRSRLDIRLVLQFDEMTTRYIPLDLEGWSKQRTKRLLRKSG
jgi:hypothetical protein